jgi:hypothetical protein
MRFAKVVKLKGGLQWLKDKGVYRSRRVLTAEEAALLGKKALTKETGTCNYDLAKQICEGHLQEFERTIAEALSTLSSAPGPRRRSIATA